MHFSNPFTPLLLSFFLFLHTALCAEPLFDFCFSQDNYSSSSAYVRNLNVLSNSLSFSTPRIGFGLASIGQGQNRVNGLTLCRGDVSSSSCKSCVLEASKEIRKRCPRKKGAIIWYDHCLFKYSNEDFFGEIDNTNKFYLYNVQDVSDPAPFNQKTKSLLSRLVKKACVSPVLYATGEGELDGSDTLYGLVQCTRDLSSSDCKKCLDGAISELPSCCDGKRGGRVVGGSCNFRYELYPFVEA
ncbi:cysteine-rich repeat secretory protein 38-like [Actinidia eriantha]|uniref:cysteine-rich repeat secretory protein 38-like n=1 Tax=Actinidia eriantha TaxID=165200 RepID=UPI002584975B|nr:cysteine-rich repeat secretory protein 38-like [Actinidia eriantha]